MVVVVDGGGGWSTVDGEVKVDTGLDRSAGGNGSGGASAACLPVCHGEKATRFHDRLHVWCDSEHAPPIIRKLHKYI